MSTQTYEEWLRSQRAKQESTVKNNYAASVNDVEKSYTEALGLINKEHERTTTDIDTSYKKNLAGYGKNAELLSSMGLASSGYSDYLNSQAFSQRSAGMRNAEGAKSSAIKNAESVRADSKSKLELQKNNDLAEIGSSYESALMEYRQQNYNNILTNAQNGMYSGYDDASMKQLIKDNNLTSDQANQLNGVISFVNQQKAEEKKKTKYQNYLTDALNGYFSEMDDAAITEKLTTEGYNADEIDTVLRYNKRHKENEEKVDKNELNNTIGGVLKNIDSGVYSSFSGLKNHLEFLEIDSSSSAYKLAVDGYQSNKANSILKQIKEDYDAGFAPEYTVKDIKSLLDSGEISPVGESQIISLIQRINKAQLVYNIQNKVKGYERLNEAIIDTMIAEGEISPDDKNEIMDCIDYAKSNKSIYDILVPNYSLFQ